MWRCEYCQTVSKPRQALRRHIVYRQVPYVKFFDGGGSENLMREEIAREIPVCAACEERIRKGAALKDLERLSSRVVFVKRKPFEPENGAPKPPLPEPKVPEPTPEPIKLQIVAPTPRPLGVRGGV